MEQTGNISHTGFAQSIVQKSYVKFSDEQVMRSSYLGRQYYWVSIEKCEAEIPIKKESASSSIKCTKFPLILSWRSTVHKVEV